MSTSTPTYRQQQAAATRERIVNAARKVFAAKGYTAATIADIAAEAGVAIPTVYKTFGNKRALLAAITDRWTAQFAPRRDASFPTDPKAALTFWAAITRRQYETGLDIALTYAGAVASEPDVQADLAPHLASRRWAIGKIAATAAPGFRPGVTRPQATALISALTLPEVYRELVRDHNWNPARYESWVTATLCAQLLREPD